MGVMKGHSVAIVQLQMDSVRDQLISVSKDNVVFVWNLKDNSPLQIITWVSREQLISVSEDYIDFFWNLKDNSPLQIITWLGKNQHICV